MKTAIRKSINSALRVAIPSFGTRIPLGRIIEIVDNKGFAAVDEDGSPLSCLLCGHSGIASFALKDKETGKIQKEAIQLQWWGEREHGCKGKIEVNVYVM